MSANKMVEKRKQTFHLMFCVRNMKAKNFGLVFFCICFTLLVQFTNSKNTNKAAARQSAASAKKVVCRGLNGKTLNTCCTGSPISDYFSNGQKTVCNSYKKNAVLFSSTKEYKLHKLANAKNNSIPLSTSTFCRFCMALKNFNTIISRTIFMIVVKMGTEACLIECLFSNAKLFADDGTVSSDLVSTYLSENLDETWASVVQTAVTNCATNIATIVEAVPSVDVTIKRRVIKTCSITPLLFTQCVIRAVNLDCPSSAQKNTTACKNVLESFTTCDPFATS
ncbi:Hypothetical predicted protein [Cloeon dipterum]|uniref:Uncharacterized protein n=1 Tax=Cloeon dipterum TaxID=197152 RepID=A0A8S1D006_9INSE|nr:Hypothetical predicted protein [Cloeon dipterum]